MREFSVFSSRFLRLCASAAVSVVFLSTGLTGCSTYYASKHSKEIDALSYIGDGLKSDYKMRIEAAQNDDEMKEIVEEATRVSNVVGTPMRPFDLLGEMSDSDFMLNEDGTVTATNEKFHALMSNATHWRLGDRTMHLCTDETCEYYSEWDVSYVIEHGAPERYRFTINTNGVESDDAENYRDLLVKK